MRCIYCPDDAANARRDAHVIPQVVGPTDAMLPRGTECDGCNEHAGGLEQSLAHHNHIWPTLMILDIPGKRSKARKRLGFMVRQKDGSFVLQARKAKTHMSPGRVEIEGPNPPEFDDGRFRRALHHVAFNHVVKERGHEHGLLSIYDEVRRYVRRPRQGETWPYAQLIVARGEQTTATLQQLRGRLGVSIVQDAPGLVVRFQCYADDWYVDVVNTGTLHEWAGSALGPSVGLL